MHVFNILPSEVTFNTQMDPPLFSTFKAPEATHQDRVTTRTRVQKIDVGPLIVCASALAAEEIVDTCKPYIRGINSAGHIGDLRCRDSSRVLQAFRLKKL